MTLIIFSLWYFFIHQGQITSARRESKGYVIIWIVDYDNCRLSLAVAAVQMVVAQLHLNHVAWSGSGKLWDISSVVIGGPIMRVECHVVHPL